MADDGTVFIADLRLPLGRLSASWRTAMVVWEQQVDDVPRQSPRVSSPEWRYLLGHLEKGWDDFGTVGEHEHGLGLR
jgi:hypothetical protein